MTNPSLSAEFKARFPRLAQDLGSNADLLLDDVSVQEVVAGRTLIRDRMPTDSIYFVLSGTLDVLVEQDGVSKKVGAIQPGEWMGEISVLSGELLASATVVTAAPCKLLKMHHITFEKLTRENTAVSRVLLDHFIALMAQRLRASAQA